MPTFLGGVHPPEGKSLTENMAIEKLMPDSGLFIYPLSQHIGAPCSPVVNKGDQVLVGQKIADTEAFVSAPIFSGVSGTVKEIAPKMTIAGSVEQCIVIENDGKYEKAPSLLDELYSGKSPEPSEYVKLIRAAGIVGMGGACFPTHVKLLPPKDKVIKWVIINAAECEPYLTCDNRLMLESPDEVLRGLEYALKIFPEAVGVVGIEDNKPEAIKTMTEHNKNSKISIMPLKVKYPQGAEKMLIKSVTGQEVPLVPALPADVGCIVLNTRTAWHICKAIEEGLPVTERVVTVTGDAIASPKNLQVPLGISVKELINACGGFRYEPVKIIAGGPMMGLAMRSYDVPVVKGTSGILALTKNLAYISEESACIRCGKCVEACPMHLEPTLLDHAVRRRDYETFEAHGGMNCIECGSCAYSCPASRHLVQSYKNGKAFVTAERKKAAAKAKEGK